MNTTLSTTVSSTHEVINPSTEQVVATVPSLSVEETDAAIARAEAAFPAWRAVSPADRGRLLRRFSEVVDAHIDAIKAVVRDEIQTDDHPTGRALAETLEARVAEHLA